MAFRFEPLTLVIDSTAPKIPRMGDVVLIDLGDGVFTGRELHTSLKLNETLQRNHSCCFYRISRHDCL